jgi:DNA polymerase-3 subunit delta
MLLVEETVQLICTAAKNKGVYEHTRTTIESTMDWQKMIYADTRSLSLFSNQKIIEFNFKNTKFTAAHGKIIADYTPLNNVILIIQTAKLDSKTEKTAWYQAIEKNTVIVTIWPVTFSQLPSWILLRAKKNNLNLTMAQAMQLANQVEGNLLAAAQEIEKLTLFHSKEPLKESDIEKMISDYAQFDIFNLVDSILLGHEARSLRILHHLFATGVEPVLILWALTRELRLLNEIQMQWQRDPSLEAVFNHFRIWDKRKPGIRSFLQRHSLPSIFTFIKKAAQIDRIIKGAEIGNVAHCLQAFTLQMSGNGIMKLLS